MGKEIILRAVRGMRIVAVLAVGGLALAAAACSDPPKDNNAGSGSGQKYSACMVTDVGGIDDRSFNASAWKGLQNAAKQNTNIDPKNTQSTAEADYVPNLTNFVNQKCKFILAVGGLMTDATKQVSTANPTQQFAIVDSGAPNANVYPMQFHTEQAAFLAGYLAAGMTKSGTVGTYGGLKIPPVTIFMDGFADGVAHYNKTKSKTVRVVGWDKAAQSGSFTNDFVKQDAGKQVGDTLAAQGADIIMPVAGGAGLGTASSAKTSGKVSVIWVDVDGCESAAQYCSVFMTTVVKNIPDAVKDAALKGADSPTTLLTGGFSGTLANNGVSIAPYHEFDSKIPADLKAEVDKLKQDIISGTIKVESAAAPK